MIGLIKKTSSYGQAAGCVLRSEPAGEHDLRLRILTAKRGKLSVLARGARKMTAHLAAHLQPGCWNEYRLLRRQNGDDLVIGVKKRLLKDHPQSWPGRLVVFYYLELIDELTPFCQPDHNLYKFLYRSCLNVLSLEKKQGTSWSREVELFEARTMDFLGYGRQQLNNTLNNIDEIAEGVFLPARFVRKLLRSSIKHARA